MLEIVKTSENRIDIHLTGKVTSAEMAIALDDLIEASQSFEKGKMFYVIEDFQMPELGAIAVEFSRLPKLFSLISKFSKCAVVANASWLRTVAEIEGALIPGLEIKSFEMGMEIAAQEWLEKA
ncbi:MAG: STAS/SEC14 domain-containing protein [Rhizobiales bacterium]|nr:STAS/SEC14 domain-containing protein [Hyphomicrobiales bacterium]